VFEDSFAEISQFYCHFISVFLVWSDARYPEYLNYDTWSIILLFDAISAL
jgi:hypothetical protein